jgi:hypothetical protein
VRVSAANDGLRFVLEVAALIAAARWGMETFDGALGVVAGVAGVAVIVCVWGLFIAPKAPRWQGDPVRLVLELAVFGTAVAAFAAADSAAAATAMAAAAAVHLALTFALGQRQRPASGASYTR